MIGINKIDVNVESDVSIITCHINNFEKKKYEIFCIPNITPGQMLVS